MIQGLEAWLVHLEGFGGQWDGVGEVPSICQKRPFSASYKKAPQSQMLQPQNRDAFPDHTLASCLYF